MQSSIFASQLIAKRESVTPGWLFLSVAALFAVNIGVRLYGLGWRSYLADGWNLFEATVVTGGLVTTALRMGGVKNSVLVQLQKVSWSTLADTFGVWPAALLTRRKPD